MTNPNPHKPNRQPVPRETVPDRPQSDLGLFVAQTDTGGAKVALSHTVAAAIGAPRLPHVCRCGVRWGGWKTAHCTACHETFSTVANFDKHRQGPHSDVTPRICVPPAAVGLVDAGRDYPCWGAPGPASDFERSAS